MIIFYSIIKTLKENLRDWKIMSLIIVFAPFFVYLMYFYLNNSNSSSYNILIINQDKDGKYSVELIQAWNMISSEDGNKVLKIKFTDNHEDAVQSIKNKSTDLFITIPEDYSDSFQNYLMTRKGLLSPIKYYGDRTNIRCMMANSFCDYVAFQYVSYATNNEVPINMTFEQAGTERKLSDFDLYVPALLVMSIIMILFTTGASIVREIEKDTITRLFLSKLTPLKFLFSISFVQILIGISCLTLTYFSARSTGYRTDGSMLLIIILGAATSFSVISISIITTNFIRTMFGLLTVGCFPYFILMFFSDCFVPLPKIHLFDLFENIIYLNDILPTATATRALNKILNYNSNISDIMFELSWIVVLSSIYFIIGVLLFKKKYKN